MGQKSQEISLKGPKQNDWEFAGLEWEPGIISHNMFEALV